VETPLPRVGVVTLVLRLCGHHCPHALAHLGGSPGRRAAVQQHRHPDGDETQKDRRHPCAESCVRVVSLTNDGEAERGDDGSAGEAEGGEDVDIVQGDDHRGDSAELREYGPSRWAVPEIQGDCGNDGGDDRQEDPGGVWSSEVLVRGGRDHPQSDCGASYVIDVRSVQDGLHKTMKHAHEYEQID